MKPLVVFMYHGLYRTEKELAAIDAAEQPYAISVDTFEQQLDYLTSVGIPVLDPHSLQIEGGGRRGVVLTFDDGHMSNFSFAMPILAKRGMRAAFFLTSDFIGTRPDFCGWSQVKAMANGGMLIGSHGRTHRFFDDMTASEVESEFRISKEIIEQEISQEVCQISFPGGRYRQDQISSGCEVGYRLFYSSKVGVVSPRRIPDGSVVSRIAVRRTTTHKEFAAFANGDPMVLLRAQVVSGAKQGVRLAIGNRLYHLLYERFTGHR